MSKSKKEPSEVFERVRIVFPLSPDPTLQKFIIMAPGRGEEKEKGRKRQKGKKRRIYFETK